MRIHGNENEWIDVELDPDTEKHQCDGCSEMRALRNYAGGLYCAQCISFNESMISLPNRDE